MCLHYCIFRRVGWPLGHGSSSSRSCVSNACIHIFCPNIVSSFVSKEVSEHHSSVVLILFKCSFQIGGGRTNQTSLPKSCQYPTNRRRVPYTNPSYIVPTSLFTLNDKHKKIKSARIFSEYEHRRRRDQRASSYSS